MWSTSWNTLVSTEIAEFENVKQTGLVTFPIKKFIFPRKAPSMDTGRQSSLKGWKMLSEDRIQDPRIDGK